MRRYFATISLSAVSLVLASTALIAVPVFADHGSVNENTTTSNTSGSGEGSTPAETGSHTTGNTPTNETETNSTRESKTEVETTTEVKDRQQGASLIAELKGNGKHHSDGEIKAACDSHKQGLETKFVNISTDMTSLKARITVILTKAETYQKTNNESVPNWSSLIAAATAAGNTADGSIAALHNLTPTLDCNSVSVAQDVATFKAAAMQAKTDLQMYKSAVKSVVKALLEAKTPVSNSSTGGQQ